MPRFALNFFLAIACSFCLASRSLAGEVSCISAGDYNAASILLIDGSASSELDEKFDQSLKVAMNQIAAKERMIVALVTERRSTVKILFDLVKPEFSVWESKLAYQKKLNDFIACSQKVNQLAKTEIGKNHDKSAILETIMFAKEVFSRLEGSKTLYIYSDMIQHSDTVSFYKLGAKDTSASLMKRVIDEKLVSELPGVKVQIAGVGGSQSDKTARLVEAFWRDYFSQSGASLDFYGPVLVH